MASHRYHPDPAQGDHADALLFDGCQECALRASQGVAGALELDSVTFAALWNRMLSVEMGTSGTYYSGLEGQMGRALYHVAVLLERNFPGSRPWDRREP